MKTSSIAFAAVCLLAGSTPAQDLDPGNVLLLIADDLGVDQLGSYGVGSNVASTPRLDAMAEGGLLFRNMWSSPTCSPTRANLQTGRYSVRTSVGSPVSGEGALPLVEITLPEMLDLATGGLWSHALIGKWHLGNDEVGGGLNPNLQGYSHFAGPLGNIPSSESYYGYTKVVDGAATFATRYATSGQVTDALEWIKDAPQPWLCVVSFSAPHYPLEAPPSTLHTVDLTGLNAHSTPKPFYNAMVEAMDTEIGRLLDSMAPAVLANTTVFFLGDNGTSSGGVVAPFDPTKAKWTVYEGGVHVPMIVSGKRVQNPGREVKGLVHTVDFFATLAALAGVDAQATVGPTVPLDSISFLPYLADQPSPKKRTDSFTEFFAPNSLANAVTTRFALRDGKHKIIRDDQAQADQFFDLLADPFEANDLLLGQLTAIEFIKYRRMKAQIDAILADALATN